MLSKEGEYTEIPIDTERKACVGGDRDLSNASGAMKLRIVEAITSQEEASKEFSIKCPVEAQTGCQLNFRCIASRTVRELVSPGLCNEVYGNFLRHFKTLTK